VTGKKQIVEQKTFKSKARYSEKDQLQERNLGPDLSSATQLPREHD